jgi:hypothetical protein
LRQVLDASSQFIFGESLNTLLGQECPADAKKFIDAFNYAKKIVGLRVLLWCMSFLIQDAKFWDDCSLLRRFKQ